MRENDDPIGEADTAEQLRVGEVGCRLADWRERRVGG
jgi:hypothetical protein